MEDLEPPEHSSYVASDRIIIKLSYIMGIVVELKWISYYSDAI